MGNAAIYWQPVGNPETQTIDLGAPLTTLVARPDHTVTRTKSISGRIFTTVHNRRDVVRVVLQQFTDDDLAGELLSLQDHLARGGWCGVAGDADKAWGVFSTGGWTRASTGLVHSATPYWNQSAAVAANDYVELVSLGAHRSQIAKVSSTAARKLTISAGLFSDLPGPAMARHELFFPYLTEPEGSGSRQIITHDHRYTWTLDMTLVTDPSALQAWAGVGATPFRTGTKPTGVDLNGVLDSGNFRSTRLKKGH